MRQLLPLILVLSLGPLPIFSQIMPNDLCDRAIPLEFDQLISGQDNSRATTTDLETPEAQPVTCIKTFENDLWYSFTTVPTLYYYEVEIRPHSCNTPAGLQAMIIQADECSSETFEYKACNNPYAERSLKMYMQETQHSLKHYIYVDGYDGTKCVFDIILRAYEKDPRTVAELKKVENDYGKAPPIFEPPAFDVSFENNEATISWEANTQDPTAFFLVQGVTRTTTTTYGRTVASVEPRNTVGAELTAKYIVVDRRAFKDKTEACYRIVKVQPGGLKAYSEPVCVTAQVMEDLYVSPVYPGKEAGVYVIKYVNRRKQNLRFSVLDKDDFEQKSLLKAKEPKGDGTINIDMKDFEPGTYFLLVEGKESVFKREFVVE